jgi:hypothetical protein
MNIKELILYLEEEIRRLELNCKVYEQQGLNTLWEIGDVRKRTCEDILKKIKGS